jgi:hypothetical protein
MMKLGKELLSQQSQSLGVYFSASDVKEGKLPFCRAFFTAILYCAFLELFTASQESLTSIGTLQNVC